MRIGIDARLYGARNRGIGQYIEQLITHLEKIDQNNDYFIFLKKENWSDFQPANPRFQKVLADYHWYGFAEQIFFPFKIWRTKLDLMHFPHWNVPLFCPCPFIVTIHDLILFEYPDRRASTLPLALYQIKYLLHRFIVKNAARRAQKIIAVSSYTKQQIIKYLDVLPEKIDVIYEGGGMAPTACPATAIAPLPYLLYVGSAYPHKNLERLILAFKEILKKNPQYSLILVGRNDFFCQKLKNFVEAMGLTEKIIFWGEAASPDLKNIYQFASLFVFPSYAEGFGFPPLEAMANAVPVVSSNVASLPEILSQAALYFNPYSLNDIIEKIQEALDNQELRTKLIQLGKQQIQKYSWTKCSQQTLAVYQYACEKQ